jgi:hypothetical protein
MDLDNHTIIRIGDEDEQTLSEHPVSLAACDTGYCDIVLWDFEVMAQKREEC